MSTTTDSTILSRRDLRFLLHEWLDVEALCERDRFADHSRVIFDDILDVAERIAEDRFAPHAQRSDEEEPQFVDGRAQLIPEIGEALAEYGSAGFFGGAMDAEVGGLQLPHTIANAAFAWFLGANIGTASYSLLTMGAANLLAANATPEQIETWVPKMASGEWFGTMCISETQAGSSVGDTATKAVPQDDGRYRLFGSKMWISGGDQDISENIVHLVLARLPDAPAGSKGISLFLVPKFLLNDDGSLGERNDVTLAGLNHKMGWRGTVNTVLGFGEGDHTPGGASGAIGWLVGQENNGLACMFHMMNEARLAVGMGATALGYTGYLKSVEYARERPQGRPPGVAPTEKQVPIMEHPDVRRMLLMQKGWVEGSMALLLYCARLLDDEHTHPDPDGRARAKLLLDMLTPVAKSFPSQWCLEANSLAIQVHGGYGYAREYGIEKLYRDNRLNPIHEGTHGIQGLDLLGRKTTMQGGDGLRLLLSTMRETVERAGAHDLAPALAARIDRIEEVTAQLWAAGNPDVSLANASVYLEAVGHVVVAWLWLEQALVAGDQEGDFYDGKRAAATFFFRYELPRVDPQFDLLASLDRTTLDMQDAWF